MSTCPSRRPSRSIRGAVAWVLAGIVTAMPAPSRAAGRPEAVAQRSGAGPKAQAKENPRNEARVLAQEGLELYDRSEYADALERFQRAYELYPAPTVGLLAARSLEKLGRLVAAAETYRDVIEPKPGLPVTQAFRQARTAAGKELAKLAPRVPKLTVGIGDATPSGSVVIFLDGEAIDGWELDRPREVDPGKHRVEVLAGSRHGAEDVRLEVGQTRRVVIRFAAPAAAEQPLEPDAPARRGSGQRTAGFLIGGLGVAGLAVWGIAGGVALGKKGDLDSSGCIDGACPAGHEDDIRAYDTSRTVSTVGFFAGVGALGLGLTLLLTAPSDTPQPEAANDARREARRRAGLTPPRVRFGPTGAVVEGSF